MNTACEHVSSKRSCAAIMWVWLQADPGPVQRMSRPTAFSEAVTGAHQIPTDVCDRADHVTKLLGSGRKHERERQLAGGQQPGQTLRVTSVGLDPIARRARDLARGDDLRDLSSQRCAALSGQEKGRVTRGRARVLAAERLPTLLFGARRS